MIKAEFGDRYGRWKVLGEMDDFRDSKGVSRRIVWCLCSCGNKKAVRLLALRSGTSISCGCFKSELRKTHGKSLLPEYGVWRDIHQRCNNKSNARFKDYGGRGISVCGRWEKFEEFYKDMGDRPSNKYSIDRINNDGDYSPENCRWATRSQQQLNKRKALCA